MTDLDEKEQDHVRATLRYLHNQMGGWTPMSKVLGFTPATLKHAAYLRGRSVSASMALRVARLIDVSIDDLLAGRHRPGACSKCGHVPSYIPAQISDFVDDDTMVRDEPQPPPSGGLKLMR